MKHLVIGIVTVKLIIVAGGMAVAGPAAALTIVPVFGSSVTTQAAADSIENAFNSVASLFGAAFSDPVTVNIDVGWNEINGNSLPASAVGASQSYLYGYYSYGQLSGLLAASAAANPANATLASVVANLPTTAPSGPTNYVVTAAEAKALGIAPAAATATDGFIGFAGSTASFGFTPAAVGKSQYDFQAVAAHEISEILGRISGVGYAWRTPLDLVRYSAPGSLSFSYRAPAYFSVDGGATSLATFDAASGGDRGDWATTKTGDAFDAFISKGQRKGVSAVDLAVLDALGWGGTNAGSTPGKLSGTAFALSGSVPEPASWALLLAGFGVVGAMQRRQRTGGSPASA